MDNDITLINSILGDGLSVKKIDTIGSFNVYLWESKSNSIPNKVIAAVNSKDRSVGFSIYDEREAMQNATIQK